MSRALTVSRDRLCPAHGLYPGVACVLNTDCAPSTGCVPGSAVSRALAVSLDRLCGGPGGSRSATRPSLPCRRLRTSSAGMGLPGILHEAGFPLFSLKPRP